ncbi:DUF4255 domain-containing protein [Amycolatopsis suaedae]|uniref:DUF4255 domain-containing protein n=1 Tax=Amycolatopsis suaedae TaxID=2510978 RepID=A0A4Q7IWL5_9PSEU|nr:DUF4255 domain-containing protein [Amycolatopsis suaedae]RZQ59321.1 DUF4255 domain-containing protein [Amycolatopsis suaedae]
MSDAKAIAAVTEALVSVIHSGVKDIQGLGAIDVTAAPPHSLTGDPQAIRVNLFLYQVEVEGSLRNTDRLDVLPGETGEPPLPLVLRYLVTPYLGDDDDVKAHLLLGEAIQMLHSRTVLTRADLTRTPGRIIDSDIVQALDRVRVTWHPMSENDIYSLWSAFSTPYRLSAAIEVKPVLIDSLRPSRSAVPVLTRGKDDVGPRADGRLSSPFPALDSATGLTVDDRGNEFAEPVAVLADTVVLGGVNLGGAVRVLLTHPLLDEPEEIRDFVSVGEREVRFLLPGEHDRFPAGRWTVAVEVATVDGPVVTNEVFLPVGPVVDEFPLEVTLSGTGTASFQLTCSPAVRAGQPVSLLLGGTVLVPDTPVDEQPRGRILRFIVGEEHLGIHPARLRIAGVDSRLIDRTTTPPTFRDQTVTVVRQP